MNKRQIKKKCKKEDSLCVGDFGFERYKDLKNFYRKIDYIRNRRTYKIWRQSYLNRLGKQMKNQTYEGIC